MQKDVYLSVEVPRCFRLATCSMVIAARAVFHSYSWRAVAAVDAANYSDARTATPFTDRQAGGSSQLPAENDLSGKIIPWLITENHTRRHILRAQNSVLFSFPRYISSSVSIPKSPNPSLSVSAAVAIKAKSAPRRPAFSSFKTGVVS